MIKLAAAPTPLLPRGEGVSAWRQIVDGLEADLAAGHLKPGDRLPAEAQLAARFGVNRHTVRRAIAVLASRGLVRATQGRGTFVEAAPLPYPIGTRTRFSQIVQQAGREPAGEMIAARPATADPWVADRLGLAADAPVLEVESRHFADGTPISRATLWVPLPRFAGFDEHYAASGSITKAFAACGVADYRRLSTRITARATGPHEAEALDLTPGRIVLVMESVNVDAAGIPVQAARSLFAADRVALTIGDA